jgi:hypothetical protein
MEYERHVTKEFKATLYVIDKIIIATYENELQIAKHQLRRKTRKYDMTMSASETKFSG